MVVVVVVVLLQPLLALCLGYENLLLVLPLKYTVEGSKCAGWIFNGESPPLLPPG